MHPISTRWKHQKTLRFSDVFRGLEKGCIGNKCVNVWFAASFLIRWKYAFSIIWFYCIIFWYEILKISFLRKIPMII